MDLSGPSHIVDSKFDEEFDGGILYDWRGRLCTLTNVFWKHVQIFYLC